MTRTPRVPEFDAEHVRDISEAVYRDRMGATDTAELLAAERQRQMEEHNRLLYVALTRAYLRAVR